jgi:hypothetical protein
MRLTMHALGLAWVLAAVGGVALGCATGGGGDGRVHVTPRSPDAEPERGGIPPDKQSEIQLVLQQRDQSTRRCYNEVLNEKHDRAFKGNVSLLITIQPNGAASEVQVVNSTLNNKEVHDCLIEKIKNFEFPQIEQAGTLQYVYRFEPAY